MIFPLYTSVLTYFPARSSQPLADSRLLWGHLEEQLQGISPGLRLLARVERKAEADDILSFRTSNWNLEKISDSFSVLLRLLFCQA